MKDDETLLQAVASFIRTAEVTTVLIWVSVGALVLFCC